MKLPAEWHHHTATWLAWPYDAITFPDKIPQVEKIYTQIIYHLHQNELINLLVLNKKMQQKVTNLLTKNYINLNQIKFHIVDYADVWIRDYGPIFLTNNTYTKWQYNAYGNKFPDLLKDNNVVPQLKIEQPAVNIDIILEGGAIDSNGHGTLLTTEECLLNPNRNNLTKPQIEKYLKTYLGVTKIIWLKKGLINDHTDGHIDEIARFINKDTILISYTEDLNNPNHNRLKNNFNLLTEHKFNLIKLPLPEFYYDDGELAPASYTNFYIANNIVLVPQFKHKNDKSALNIIQSCFSNRKTIGIDCTDLIYGGGTIHCITQQQS